MEWNMSLKTWFLSSVSCLGRPCLSEDNNWFSPIFSFNIFIICVLYLDLYSFKLFLYMVGAMWVQCLICSLNGEQLDPISFHNLPFPHLLKMSPLFYLFIYLFIYFYLYFLAALGLRCCAWAFSSCGEQGLLFVAVHWLLIVVASLVAEHGL